LGKTGFSGYYELQHHDLFPYRSTSIQPAARLWSGWQGSYYHWIRLGDVEVWSDFLITPDFKTAKYSCEEIGGSLPVADAEALDAFRSSFLAYKFSLGWVKAVTAIEHVMATSTPSASTVFPNFPIWMAPSYQTLYSYPSIEALRAVSWERAWKMYRDDFYQVQMDAVLGAVSLTEAEAVGLYAPGFESPDTFRGFTYPLYKGMRFAPEASAKVFTELGLESSPDRVRALFGVARTIEAGMKILRQTKGFSGGEAPSLGIWLEDGRALVSGETLSMEEASGVWEVYGEISKDLGLLARDFSHVTVCMRPASVSEAQFDWVADLDAAQTKNQYEADQKALKRVNETYRHDYYSSLGFFENESCLLTESQKDYYVESSLSRYESKMGKSFRDGCVAFYQSHEEARMEAEIVEKLDSDRKLYESQISHEIQQMLVEQTSPAVIKKKLSMKNLLSARFQRKKESVSSRKTVSKEERDALLLHLPGENDSLSRRDFQGSDDGIPKFSEGLPMSLDFKFELKNHFDQIFSNTARKLDTEGEDADLNVQSFFSEHDAVEGCLEQKQASDEAEDMLKGSSVIKKKSSLTRLLTSKFTKKKEADSQEEAADEFIR